jgi:hypothetical protein
MSDSWSKPTAAEIPRRRVWAARTLIVAAGIGAWFFTQYLVSLRDPPSMGIDDAMHKLLTPVNDWLGAPEHRPWTNALLIVSTAFVDGLAIFVLVRSIFGPSIRPLLGLFMLFALRQLCQGLCSLPPPKGMIWDYPGFPALLVTYGVSYDLFFSGHTAVAVYGAIELARLGGRWLAAGLLIAVFEALTVLALRAHYTMDVFAAAVTALYSAGLATAVAPACDRALARLCARRSDRA